MPLHSGYGYEVVGANVAELQRTGVPRNGAIAAAYALGRVSFFKRYPGGALPNWLAYPKTHRMRQHYDKRGNPLFSPVSFRDNPHRPDLDNLADAAQLYEDFTGHAADRVTMHKLPEMPREGLVFGTLVQVGYESERDGKLYQHTFRERSRPLLVATHDGKMVLIVGGRYAFTDRGIVDR